MQGKCYGNDKWGRQLPIVRGTPIQIYWVFRSGKNIGLAATEFFGTSGRKYAQLCNGEVQHDWLRRELFLSNKPAFFACVKITGVLKSENCKHVAGAGCIFYTWGKHAQRCGPKIFKKKFVFFCTFERPTYFFLYTFLAHSLLRLCMGISPHTSVFGLHCTWGG